MRLQQEFNVPIFLVGVGTQIQLTIALNCARFDRIKPRFGWIAQDLPLLRRLNLPVLM